MKVYRIKSGSKWQSGSTFRCHDENRCKLIHSKTIAERLIKRHLTSWKKWQEKSGNIFFYNYIKEWENAEIVEYELTKVNQ